MGEPGTESALETLVRSWWGIARTPAKPSPVQIGLDAEAPE